MSNYGNVLSNILVFFFNDTATTEIYTLSLHDALPISEAVRREPKPVGAFPEQQALGPTRPRRSEEHTSELQSQSNLVCRLLLEKKNNTTDRTTSQCSRFNSVHTRRSTSVAPRLSSFSC